MLIFLLNSDGDMILPVFFEYPISNTEYPMSRSGISFCVFRSLLEIPCSLLDVQFLSIVFMSFHFSFDTTLCL